MDGRIRMKSGTLQLFANTEQDFITNLKLILHDFRANILKDGSLFSEVSKEEVDDVFGVYPALLTFHQDLLQALAKTQSLPETFNLKMVTAMFHAYRGYITGYASAQEKLAELKEKLPAFAAVISATEKETGKDLSELMGLPITNTKNYVAFLNSYIHKNRRKTMVKNLKGEDDTDDETKSIVFTIEALGELCVKLEKVQNAFVIQRAVRSIKGYPQEDKDEVPPDRYLVLDVPVTVQSGGVGTQGRCILFSDMLVITKKNPTKKEEHEFPLILAERIRLQELAMGNSPQSVIGETAAGKQKWDVEVSKDQQQPAQPIGLVFGSPTELNDFRETCMTLRKDIDANKSK